MLRGLDAADGDPDRVVVRVAGRETLDGRLRVYLRSGVSAVVGERQSRVRETIGQLESAGVVADVEVTEWPDRVRTPADGDVEADAVALYDEFVEVVGHGPERRPRRPSLAGSHGEQGDGAAQPGTRDPFEGSAIAEQCPLEVDSQADLPRSSRGDE